PAAAGEAEVDQLRSGPEPLDHRPARRRDFAGKLLLEAAVGKASGDRSIGADGKLRAEPARKAALDSDDRAEPDARLAGGAKGGAVIGPCGRSTVLRQRQPRSPIPALGA